MAKRKFTEEDCLNREQKKVAAWLKKVRFRKCLFGGVNERDVWKKIGELTEMYNAAVEAERVRYDALLEQRAKDEARTANAETPDFRFDTDLTGGERGRSSAKRKSASRKSSRNGAEYWRRSRAGEA